MTRLQIGEVHKLASHVVSFTVSQSILMRGNGESAITAELSTKAARIIAGKTGHEVSGREVHPKVSTDDATGLATYDFRWEPRARGYSTVELIGGQADGTAVEVPPGGFPTLRVPLQEAPTHFDSEAPTTLGAVGEYELTGWDTTEKKWLFTWRRGF